MKMIVLCVLAVAAVARADYHDDVFHFSTVNRPSTAFRGAYQHAIAAPRARFFQPAAQYFQPATTTVTKYFQQPDAQYYEPAAVAQFIRPATAYRREYYSEQPAVFAPDFAAPRFDIQAAAVPASYQYAYSTGGSQARILEHTQEAIPSGPYRAHYRTENGISSTEVGALTTGTDGPAIAKQGSYSYTGPDGRQYSVNWVADEFGFRAAGDHLPTPPSVPGHVNKKK